MEQDCALLRETKNLLAQTEKSLQDISFDTKLPVGWLTSVKRGVCTNPGVNRVVALYEYLSGRTLGV